MEEDSSTHGGRPEGDVLADIRRGWERWCLGKAASTCEGDDELAGWLYAAVSKATASHLPVGGESARFGREDLRRARMNLRLAPPILRGLNADALPRQCGRREQLAGVSPNLRNIPDRPPRELAWFSRLDVVEVFLAPGSQPELLEVLERLGLPGWPAAVVHDVADALVALDRAASQGLYEGASPATRAGIDRVIQKLMAGERHALPSAAGILRSLALGGLDASYPKIVAGLRKAGRVVQGASAVWTRQAELAQAGYLAGDREDMDLVRRFGWTVPFIIQLRTNCGLREPSESGRLNAQRPPNAQVGWGWDQRCRDREYESCSSNWQRAGWLLANTRFADPLQPPPREGAPVSWNLAYEAMDAYQVTDVQALLGGARAQRRQRAELTTLSERDRAHVERVLERGRRAQSVLGWELWCLGYAADVCRSNFMRMGWLGASISSAEGGTPRRDAAQRFTETQWNQLSMNMTLPRPQLRHFGATWVDQPREPESRPQLALPPAPARAQVPARWPKPPGPVRGSVAPRNLMPFSRPDVLTAFVSEAGCGRSLLAIDPRQPLRLTTTAEARQALDDALAQGLRDGAPRDMLAAIDAALVWLEAGDHGKVALAEALINAGALGGFEQTYTVIVRKLRASGRLVAAGQALWREHAALAYRGYLEGFDDEGLGRRYGWSAARISELVLRQGLRHPRHSAGQNATREPRSIAAEVGWGVDARCRRLPERGCLTEEQHAGWVWADSRLGDSATDEPYVGMPVDLATARDAVAVYEREVERESQQWRAQRS